MPPTANRSSNPLIGSPTSARATSSLFPQGISCPSRRHDVLIIELIVWLNMGGNDNQEVSERESAASSLIQVMIFRVSRNLCSVEVDPRTIMNPSVF
jgi:hypothetical protein